MFVIVNNFIFRVNDLTPRMLPFAPGIPFKHQLYRFALFVADP